MSEATPGYYKPLAVIIGIIAIALSIWGSATFAAVSGIIWEKGPAVWSWGAAFLSLGFDFWRIVGGIFWVVGTVLFIMELAGFTIRKGRIVRQVIKWDSIDIAIAALVAAIYGGGLVATAGLIVIPGFTWIRPANMLSPVFGILFGIPGCVGLAFGNLIADALGGFLSFGSIGGFVGNFLLGYVPYKLMRDHTLRTSKSVFDFYLWGVLVGSLWCSLYISWWLDMAKAIVGLPPLFVWGWFAPFVIINNSIVTAIAGPPLAYALYPPVKRWGLHWSDRTTFLEKS